MLCVSAMVGQLFLIFEVEWNRKKKFPSNWRWASVRAEQFTLDAAHVAARRPHIFEINWHYMRTNTLRATYPLRGENSFVNHWASPTICVICMNGRNFLILIYFDNVSIVVVSWLVLGWLVGCLTNWLVVGCRLVFHSANFIENLFAFSHKCVIVMWCYVMNCTCVRCAGTAISINPINHEFFMYARKRPSLWKHIRAHIVRSKYNVRERYTRYQPLRTTHSFSFGPNGKLIVVQIYYLQTRFTKRMFVRT